ncbi:MAG: TIGR03663 family protein [Chloroflexi bacterium]|nr:MAG: TIGR03663 family protein [Chloroflexota bacterium]
MSDEKRTWLDRTPIPALPWLTIEVMVFAIFVLLAVLTRFYDLETRVMSHDESLHTYYSWTLSQGQGYQHNPMMHGPLQFHMLALAYFIFGSSDFTARIPAVLFSIATVYMLWYWRRYLGKAGVLAAAAMMVISPYMLYYGRYVRNEAFAALFGVLTLYAVLRYFETGISRYLYLLAAATVLHFLVKETAFIYTAQLLLFLAAYLIAQITRKPWEENENDYRGFIISLLVGMLSIGGALIAAKSGGQAAGDAAETISPAIPGEAASQLAAPASGSMTTVVLVLIGLLGLAAAIYFLVRSYGLEKVRQERSFDMLMLVGTLVLPMLTPFAMKVLSPFWQNTFGASIAIPISSSDLSTFTIASMVPMGIILIIGIAISVVVGLWWNKETWWKAALLFYALFTIFYTTVFTNGAGFFTGLLGSLGYWLEQQPVERGSQPWYYYMLIQVPIYEFLPLLASIFAAIIGSRRLAQAREQADSVSTNLPNTYALLGWWSFSSLIAFTIAGEKMPWLTVHITLPMILWGGWAIGSVIERMDWDDLKQRKGLLVLALMTVFTLSIVGLFLSLLGEPRPFAGKDLAQLQATTTFIFALIGAVGSGWGLFRLLDGWALRQMASLNALIFFGILAILTTRASIRANYVLYDTGMEYLVYAHSFTGVKDVLKQVMELSNLTTGTDTAIVVAYDDDTSWPMSWYMRDFKNARFYGGQPGIDLREVPAIIVGDNNFSKIEPIVGNAFYRYDYIRMVWPNQDYFNLISKRPDPSQPFDENYSCKGALGIFRLFRGSDFSRVCNAIGDPAMRAAMFNIWLDRDFTRYAELTGSQGLTQQNWDPADRMRLYIRKDVAKLVWKYGVAPTEVVEADPYEKGVLTLDADLIIGSQGAEAGQLNAPRGIAFAPDGSFFVTDSRNHRIQRFSADGQPLKAWGSFADQAAGAAPIGTFNEPWGIAFGPDGSVYVTDTWNHRVQKFTADGAPIKMWGVFGLPADAPDALYGPRGIAVSDNGLVYVADTGNKRIVVYDPDGKVVTQFGSEGFDPGMFSEPVDVKVDKQGFVYVTDTWNQRVQVFGYDGAKYYPTLQWPIAGWYGQSLDNKPFMAVSPNGHVFVTDPEGYRVIEFTTEGEYVQIWGTFGAEKSNFGLAAGVAVDANGQVWVTDAGNHRVMRFTVPEK